MLIMMLAIISTDFNVDSWSRNPCRARTDKQADRHTLAHTDTHMQLIILLSRWEPPAWINMENFVTNGCQTVWIYSFPVDLFYYATPIVYLNICCKLIELLLLHVNYWRNWITDSAIYREKRLEPYIIAACDFLSSTRSSSRTLNTASSRKHVTSTSSWKWPKTNSSELS